MTSGIQRTEESLGIFIKKDKSMQTIMGKQKQMELIHVSHAQEGWQALIGKQRDLLCKVGPKFTAGSSIKICIHNLTNAVGCFPGVTQWNNPWICHLLPKNFLFKLHTLFPHLYKRNRLGPNSADICKPYVFSINLILWMILLYYDHICFLLHIKFIAF